MPLTSDWQTVVVRLLLTLLATALFVTSPFTALADDAARATRCSADVAAWAARASARSKMDVSAADCPRGVVRLHVAGAGCDFEVSSAREAGFRRTADGAFGVSPIADIDWNEAPPAMKRALDGVVAALEADPSLGVPTGERVLGGTDSRDTGTPSLWRRPKLVSLAVVAVLALASVVYRLVRRRKVRAASAGSPDA